MPGEGRQRRPSAGLKQACRACALYAVTCRRYPLYAGYLRQVLNHARGSVAADPFARDCDLPALLEEAGGPQARGARQQCCRDGRTRLPPGNIYI